MSIIYNEIKSQYDALVTTKERIDLIFPEIKDIFSNKDHPIVFIGCGSSYLIACSAATGARLHLKRESMAIAAGDLLLHTDTYAQILNDAIIVVLSRSGESSEIVMSLESLRKRNVSFYLITFSCVTNSILSEVSDYTVNMPWAYDNSVCQTRTVSCLYFATSYMIAMLSNNQGMIDDLSKVIVLGRDYMERIEDSLKDISKLGWTSVIVLGDAELCGICEEGALAFKEICQVSSNYYHFLDVRHGPIVLVNDKTLVIAVTSNNSLEDNLLTEIAAKGATVVAYRDMPAIRDDIVNLHLGESISHIARGIPLINICQLIAYYKSYQTGTNPDQPQGLEAWIKLEG